MNISALQNYAGHHPAMLSYAGRHPAPQYTRTLHPIAQHAAPQYILIGGALLDVTLLRSTPELCIPAQHAAPQYILLGGTLLDVTLLCSTPERRSQLHCTQCLNSPSGFMEDVSTSVRGPSTAATCGE